MSEGGERMCPLCAEEMDLTDQHLKPCKCGYEICVWCWHHIIDMAEKDETEGRCPACRTPYNKEKIVGMTANTEKLASEMCVEKKLKSHKGKSKTSEGRKQLGSVRVIQRNLVYVLGLPLNFADEDLLQRKEYFGQYGKVLKASISRTATGAIQHFANSTCSVYITFSKEEEAIRCIQSVNGFVMDARPIKACFGTTKYCHAWLRNMPCSNPDCLYLHEIGSQEDSFTKDEVISAYTRSRVQQITGATNSMQRSSGNVLPSPADENSNNSPALTGKLINKTATCTNQNSANGSVISPPNNSSGRTAALPAGASWGTRSFNNQPLSATTPCSNGPLKPDACNGLVASSAEVANTIQVSSLQTNTGKKLVPVEENFISLDKIKLENLVPAKKESKPDSIAGLKSSSISVHPMTSPLNHQLHGIDTTKSPNNLSKMVDSSLTCGPALDNNSMDATDEIMENICSDFLLIGVHNHAEQIKEVVTSEAPGRSANMTSAPCFTEGLSDFGLVIPTQAAQDLCETKDDMLSFDNQRLKDPEVSARINHLPDIFNSIHMPKLSTVSSVLNTADASSSVDLCGQVVDKKDNSTVSPSNFPLKFGGHPYSSLNSVDANDVEYSNLFSSKDKKLQQGRYEGELAIGAGNIGENSIISNILSMDLDSLDESLTSPQNLAKFLGETDKSQGSFGVSGSWKIQNSNQSRFSFAREDTNQATHFGPSSVFVEKDFMQRSFANDVPYSNNMHLNNDKFATRNNFPFLGGTETDVFANNHPHISSNKLSASRSQISAPPGFSATSRTAPPGFSSYEMADQILGTLSGNHILDTSSFSRNQWQTPPSNHTFSHCDIEFMDPAILEVRHGTLPGDINSSVLDVRSSYSPQLNSFEESRLQSFLQRSLPPHTNQRINELGDGFSSIADAYGVRSRVMEQTLSNNFSPFSQVTHPQPRNAIASNGQWNGWNEGTGANNLGMAELLRNERLGFNKLYGGYEDSKIHMPSSGNMYNGSYGI